MARRTTSPLERVDLLLAQAEQFAALDNAGEAIARGRQVIAYAERDRALAAHDLAFAEALGARELLAEALIARLGGASVRDRRGRLRVHADDAAVPGSWN